MDDDVSKPTHAAEPGGSVTPPAAAHAPPTGGSPQAAVFDRAAAMDHVGDDTEVLRAIVEMFLQQGPGRLAAIVEAAQEGDAVALESSAHALKGSAATLGLERVRALSLGLEQLGESGSTAGAQARLEELKVAVEEGLEALRHALEDPV